MDGTSSYNTIADYTFLFNFLNCRLLYYIVLIVKRRFTCCQRSDLKTFCFTDCTRNSHQTQSIIKLTVLVHGGICA